LSVEKEKSLTLGHSTSSTFEAKSKEAAPKSYN